MAEYKVVVSKIEGCEEGIMIVEQGGFLYVGMEFAKIGVSRFACSPAYRTLAGALRFAKKRYKAK